MTDTAIGLGLLCRSCGTVALRTFPRAVTRDDWTLVLSGVRPGVHYSLCPECRRREMERLSADRRE